MFLYNPLNQFEVFPFFFIKLWSSFVFFNFFNFYSLFLIFLLCFLFLLNKKQKFLFFSNVFYFFFIKIYFFLQSILKQNIFTHPFFIQSFFPLTFTLFIMILFTNLFGLIPFSFTSTSYIIETFVLSCSFFIGLTLLVIFFQGLILKIIYIKKFIKYFIMSFFIFYVIILVFYFYLMLENINIININKIENFNLILTSTEHKNFFMYSGVEVDRNFQSLISRDNDNSNMELSTTKVNINNLKKQNDVIIDNNNNGFQILTKIFQFFFGTCQLKAVILYEFWKTIHNNINNGLVVGEHLTDSLNVRPVLLPSESEEGNVEPLIVGSGNSSSLSNLEIQGELEEVPTSTRAIIAEEAEENFQETFTFIRPLQLRRIYDINSSYENFELRMNTADSSFLSNELIQEIERELEEVLLRVRVRMADDRVEEITVVNDNESSLFSSLISGSSGNILPKETESSENDDSVVVECSSGNSNVEPSDGSVKNVYGINHCYSDSSSSNSTTIEKKKLNTNIVNLNVSDSSSVGSECSSGNSNVEPSEDSDGPVKNVCGIFAKNEDLVLICNFDIMNENHQIIYILQRLNLRSTLLEQISRILKFKENLKEISSSNYNYMNARLNLVDSGSEELITISNMFKSKRAANLKYNDNLPFTNIQMLNLLIFNIQYLEKEIIIKEIQMMEFFNKEKNIIDLNNPFNLDYDSLIKQTQEMASLIKELKLILLEIVKK